MKNEVVTVNEAQLANIFAEWRRRYEADPDSFMTEMEMLASGPNSYGEACARYFLRLAKEPA